MTRAAVLGALVCFALDTASADGPSELTLHELVDEFAHAVETNNLELAMSLVHPDTPARSEIDTALRDQLSWCLERARTVRMIPVSASATAVVAAVDQRIVRVFGLKQVRLERTSIFEFRRLGDRWRIWRIEEGGPASTTAFRVVRTAGSPQRVGG